jgi:hypothetical protein
MKFTIKTILKGSLLTSLLTFSACSSAHPYNENYGLIEDEDIDDLLAKEELIKEIPIEVEIQSDDPELTTELQVDPDAVTAEEYVQEPPVYTYKYRFDPKFYEKGYWRKE